MLVGLSLEDIPYLPALREKVMREQEINSLVGESRKTGELTPQGLILKTAGTDGNMLSGGGMGWGTLRRKEKKRNDQNC